MEKKCVFPFARILIIGVGVMGGSYLKKLQEFDCKLYIYDLDLEVVAAAKELGLIFEYLDIYADNLPEIDLVFITLPINATTKILKDINGKFMKNTLVTDITGIKNNFLQTISSLELSFQYISGHPMAGRENGGFAYADATIFNHANYIYVTDLLHADEIIEEKFIQAMQVLGFQNIIKISSDLHDRAITYTSQLTHIIALSLLNSKEFQKDTQQMIGDSFRDLTRIAQLNIPMWEHLFWENKEYLLDSIELFQEQLSKVADYLKHDEQQALHDFLVDAKKRRMLLEKNPSE